MKYIYRAYAAGGCVSWDPEVLLHPDDFFTN